MICSNSNSIIKMCGTECDKIATGVCGTTTVSELPSIYLFFYLFNGLKLRTKCNIVCSQLLITSSIRLQENQYFILLKLIFELWIFFSSNFNPLQSKTIFLWFLKFNHLFYSGLVSDDSLNSTIHFNDTMNSYWNNCKMKNKFITGNTDIVCQNTSTWTGIRKYKIGTNKVFKLLFDVNLLIMLTERIFFKL